jgi:uncharacterized coiled-coil protein SlyX
VSDRRRSTLKPVRANTNDLSKSLELEQRIARLELSSRALRETIEALTKKTVALQAQLDHLLAKIRVV